MAQADLAETDQARPQRFRVANAGVAFALPFLCRIAAGDVSFQMIDCCILLGDQPFQ